MFFFRHPKPVVDPRPVAEQSVQFEQPALPTLIVPVAKPRAEGAEAAAVSPALAPATKQQP